MHIIFESLTPWQIPILKLLKHLKFKVFYLNIKANSDFKKNEIAENLKKKNIFPLPIELEKEILPSTSYCFFSDLDPSEIAYKRNMKLVPDKILKKYCNLFSIKDGKIKKLRLLLQNIICMQLQTSILLDIWSDLYPSKRIIYVSFGIMSFYMANKSSKLIKVIIPLDITNFFTKRIFKIFPSFFTANINKNNLNREKKICESENFEKQEIALFPHKGIFFGPLFEKSLYYSDNVNSIFNKYNLLHLDYSNFSSPDKAINWVCMNTINVPNRKIFFKTLLFSIKTFYLIRSWSTFLGWLLCVQQYLSYTKYFEIIKKFKKLKIALIDYDILCPKTLILALENNNVKTVATQERFFHTFYNAYAVICDTYFVGSDFAADFIKKMKNYDIKNIISVGQYRSDYIPFYKKQAPPKEIAEAKERGKKILIVLGVPSPNNWFESYTNPMFNWSSQKVFLEDIIKLSQNLKNTFIVLRYKSLAWTENEYFKKIFDKIHRCENIIFSNNYEEFQYSYKLCAHADLVISKSSSLADECLCQEIPVLFHEYTHNIKNISSDITNYIPQELMFYNFEELYQKSKSFLFSNSSELRKKVKELNKKIYFVNEKKNIKKKILENLENQLIKNKP